MASPWKALSDDNRRQIMLLLKNKLMMPAVSTSLRILKETDLITEIKKGKNRFYSLNRKMTLELVRFFDDMYDYNLNITLKEYVKNKESKERKRK